MAAATWLGGMILLAALVVAFRRHGVERSILQLAARRFAVVSWTAMAVAVATGVAQVHLGPIPWTFPPLHRKIALVAATVLLALVHTWTAARLPPAARGAMEAALLLLSLAIFHAAVRMW